MDAALAGVITTGALGALGIATTFFAPTWSQTKMERRRETRELRRARRLVADELDTAHRWIIVLRDAMAEENHDPCPRMDLATAEWDGHKGVLATEMSEQTWDRLAIAYNNIWTVNQVFKEARPRAGLTQASHDIVAKAEYGVRTALDDLQAASGAPPQTDS